MSKEIVLSVRRLRQYFTMGRGKNKITVKAVHNISFDIYKGEVFGLVGESGCGKTTTGRSIIKLYDITSGDIYFNDQRVSAGTREYKLAIDSAKNEIKQYDYEINLRKKQIKQAWSIRLDELQKEHLEKKQEIETAMYEDSALLHDKKEAFNQECINEITKEKLSYDQLIDEVKGNYDLELKNQNLKTKEELLIIIEENLNLIREAKKDHKNADKIYANRKILEYKEKHEKDYNNQVIKLANLKHLPKTDEIKEEINQCKQEIKTYLKDIKTLKKERLITKIQMIFQDPIASLNPRMTVKEIIAEGLRIKGVKDNQLITKRVNEALETVGLLPEHATRYPHEFSGGQRQRIGVARALIMQPELIVADEPVSALDVSIQAQVINLLNEVRQKLGLTILFIAHDLSVVKYFCDRIAVMYYGRIVELASSDELFKNPLHPYTKALLSAIPHPDPHFEKNRKRIVYNPKVDHEYSVDKPYLREIANNHFVYANNEEVMMYKKILKK